MAKAVRVVISGRVQGVGYRTWTVATASGMGLKGWVRNRADGTVEAVFHGEEDVRLTMIEACKDGPPAAHVDGIEIFHWSETVDEKFTTRPTV